MITDDPNATPSLPPPPGDPEAQRRERMLAFRLGAIDDPEEEQLIRGRLESDPDWQRADREAAAMLKGLAEDGQESSEVPVDLGLRTVRRLAAPETKKTAAAATPAAPAKPAPRFFFTPRLAAAIFLCCALPVLWAALHGFGTLEGEPALRWQPESALAAGGSFVPDVEVRDTVSGEARDGVRLAGFLEPLDAPADLRQPLALGERTTGAAGRPDGEPWKVPGDLRPGKYRLRIDALDGGSVIDSVAHDVSVARADRLALAPDRPQARPGETLRARVLVVEGAAQRPAAHREVVLELVDPAGNRLLRQTRRTSVYGLAWAEFPIDSEAPEGGYLLRAQAGDLHAQRTVPVLQYRLPPFRVTVETDEPWFRDRVPVRGAVTARTFDGEPVAGAKGVLRMTMPDGTVHQTINLHLDAQGRGRFDARPLPGAEPGQSVRPVRLEAELTDPAERSATGEKIVNISREALVVSAVPEAGDLVQGVPNRVYVVVRTPDGQPARAHLRVAPSEALNSEWSDYETDAAGVAELEMKNPRAPAETLAMFVRPSGVAAEKNLGTGELYFSLPVRTDLPAKSGDTRPSGKLLLRCDQAVVQAGGKMKFSLRSWYDVGAVTVQLRADGRTLAAATVQLERGRAAGELTVPENASGILSVEARMPYYRYEWLDRRVVAVAGNAALKVAASAGKPKYRPGETARLDFHVTDAGGQGVPAAVSVVALDESLLAIAGPHPGLAQALQAAGVEVFRTPGMPLDLAGFGVAAGSSPAARAAAAAAQPRTVEGARTYLAALANSGKLELAQARRIEEIFLRPASGPELQERAALIDVLKREGLWNDLRGLEGLDREPARAGAVDHGPELLARATKAQRVARQQALEWGLAAAVAVLALLGLLFFINVGTASRTTALQAARTAVPVFTIGLAVAGIVALVLLGQRNPVVLLCALTLTLLGSHALLLWRIGQLREDGGGGGALFVVTTLVDGVLLGCTMGMLAYGIDSGYAGVAVAAAVIGGILQAINWSATAQFARAIGLTVAGVLTMVFIAGIFAVFFSFGSGSKYKTQVVSREAVNQAPAVAFDEDVAARGQPVAKPGFAWGHKTESGATTKPMPTVVDPYHTEEPSSTVSPSEQIFPRLRYDFRETMLFEPQLVCDEDGKASIEFPVADSLTTWRVQADCIGMGGGTGFGTAKVVVTQPFSIDATLPSDVTAGDRLRVPAVVQNFTDKPHDAQVTFEAEGEGVKIEGPATQSVSVPAKGVASVEFAVFFERPGTATLRLTARAAGQADAAERLLPVRPAGEPVGFAAGGVFAGNGELLIAAPEYAYPDSLGATLSIHRGPLTQMVDGLDGMLREPHGCFEQTSSTNYPNIMILRYLKAHGLQDAALERRARDYLARGYQRLLGFEVSGGGFSLYGRSPASPWLTAYGLMQFRDLDAVQPVDPALLARTRDWLLRQRGADGRFTLDRPVHTELWANGANASDVRDLPSTAYAVLALGADAPQESVQFIARNARAAGRDPYLCALCALALQPHDSAAATALAEKLRALAKTDKVGDQEHVSLPAQQTLSWGYGNAAATEATALGVLALLKTGTDVDLAVKLLNHLQRSASSGGAWGSTHATVLALKALEQSSSIQAPAGGARVVVELDGLPLPALELPEQESAEAPSVRLKLKPGANRLLVKVAGGPVTLRVDGRAFVPLKAGTPDPAAELWTGVAYDRTKLARGETVRGTLVLKAKTRKAEVPMAEWGVPAGFAPVAEDLDALVKKGELARWERSGRTVRLYLPDLEPAKVVRLPVRFRADARGTLQAAPGRVYEYYRRNESVALAPVTFEVE